ncbi:MAG: YggT family protein [Chitinivibrionales bacterium]|nr:YggT family protein [Chitinivibrionales bacterium]
MIVLYNLIKAYEALIIVRVLLSWIQPNPNNRVVELVYKLTDPILNPIRRMLPTGNLPVDFSPLIVLFILELLKRAL